MPPVTPKCSVCVIPHLMFLLCDLNPPGSAPVSSCCCPSAWLHLLWWRAFFCAVCTRLKIRGGFCACLLFKQLALRFVCLLWVQAYPVAPRCCSRAAFKAPRPPHPPIWPPGFKVQIQAMRKPGVFIAWCAAYLTISSYFHNLNEERLKVKSHNSWIFTGQRDE